jgi:hypothetical protein
MLVTLAGIAACACGGRTTAKPSRPAPNEPAAPSAKPEAATAAPELPSRPPPTIALRGEVDDKGVGLVLEQRDAKQVKLKTAIAIQRGKGGRFEPLPEGALALRDSCKQPAAECIELVPGAELRPPPWPSGAAQCAGKGAALAPGRYRFVAQACDGSYRVEGEPFVIE